MPNTRVLIIQDLSSLIVKTIPLIKLHGKEFNISNEEIDYFLDWAINQTLIEKYNMKVINHYRHDIFICLYSIILFDLHNCFHHCVNQYDIKILEGCEVKTLINGRDLFITKRSSYSLL